jgi:hypothetical protein
MLKVGIALNVRDGLMPVNGLRHPPQADTVGWYIWAGELSSYPDFFKPLHVEHLPDWCPAVLRYLGLPPGWRFLIAVITKTSGMTTRCCMSSKLGEPASIGGGGFTSMPPIWPIPHWVKYRIGNAVFHFQLDNAGRVDLVMLMTQEPQTPDQPEDRLIMVVMPSLVSLLWRREKEKGSPLTEQEVLEIRDTAPAIALPPEGLAAVEEGRGYRDIDPNNCWPEWQRSRLELLAYDQNQQGSD